MKNLSKAALAALLGTTLLATNAFGFQTYSRNAVGFDEKPSDSNEDAFVDDPDSDRDGEIVDADSTLTDNPEQTDITLPADDDEDSSRDVMSRQFEDDVESPDSIEDITGVMTPMSHMDPIEDDVESSDSIENVDAGSPSGSDSEANDSNSGIIVGAGSPAGSDSETPLKMDTGNDIGQQATEDTAAIDHDPSVEEEDDEAVPGPGDMEEQLKEMHSEEGGS